MLADVLLFEAPVFGSGALDGDLDRVVAVAAVDGGGQAGLIFSSASLAAKIAKFIFIRVGRMRPHEPCGPTGDRLPQARVR